MALSGAWVSWEAEEQRSLGTGEGPASPTLLAVCQGRGEHPLVRLLPFPTPRLPGVTGSGVERQALM